MLREHAMNERLVANLEALRLGTEAVQYLRVQTDRDELPCLAAKWRPPDAAHRPQLPVRRFRDIREVNPRLSDRTPPAPCGSLAVR